jgi:hypothetical protein
VLGIAAGTAGFEANEVKVKQRKSNNKIPNMKYPASLLTIPQREMNLLLRASNIA